MKKYLFIALLCGFFAKAQNITYYVDASNGDDNNTGLDGVPWKSLNKVQTFSNSGNGFSPGDKILFKRGEVWENQTLDFRSSGTSSAPIIIGAYGSGHVPVLSSVSPLDVQILNWNYVGDGVWKTSEEIDNPGRLFTDYDPRNDLSSNELLKAYDVDNVGHETYSAVDLSVLPNDMWYWSSDPKPDFKILFIYTGSSSINPKDLKLYKSTSETNSHRNMTIIGQHYITIRDIEIQGGVDCLYIGSKPDNSNGPYESSGDIRILNCKIGKYSTAGILLFDTNDNTISDNVFDTNYRIQFGLTAEDAEYVSVQERNIAGVDSRGVGDGVNIDEIGSNNSIHNNSFYNWVHAGVFITVQDNDDGSEPDPSHVVSDNKIYNNYVTAPLLSYSRGFAISGVNGRVHHNEIYNNLVKNTRVQSQIAGNDNLFHHNIIDGINRSDVRWGKSNGIKIANNSPSFGATGNKFDHNTILNCDGAGISVNNWSKIVAGNNTTNPVEDNYFRNNIIYNCGKDETSSMPYIGFIIADNEHGSQPEVRNNTYYNNLIYSFNENGGQELEVISYNQTEFTTGGGVYSVLGFENNLIEGDIATGNIAGNPKFLDDTFVTGYHLKDDSPCYDTGKWITSQEASYLSDYYGSDFPYNSSPDIGHEEISPKWTYLIDQYCDMTLSLESGLLECYEVTESEIVSYQFKFVDISDNTESYYNTINATDGLPIHQMDLYARWWAKPKTTYNVEVKGFKSDGTSFSTGKVCQVTIPHLTHIKEEFCGVLPVDDLNNATDGIIECYPILDATEYKFKFYDPITEVLIQQVSSTVPTLDMYSQSWVVLGTTYSVKVRAETSNQSFSVGDACLVTVPSALSRIIGSSKGNIKNKESEISIYPNPTENQLTIKSKTSFDRIHVYDINGRLLHSEMFLNQSLEFQLDVTSLARGLYFVEIQSGNSKQAKKFIKK
ncbi:hypothetical protein A9Q86_08540 [Flavobacteriales bacterium 33_180_T64]|nr:hypothetical protein A9Q86_08540 [Flavobacteriales bacterium 33_180_T64]